MTNISDPSILTCTICKKFLSMEILYIANKMYSRAP